MAPHRSCLGFSQVASLLRTPDPCLMCLISGRVPGLPADQNIRPSERSRRVSAATSILFFLVSPDRRHIILYLRVRLVATFSGSSGQGIMVEMSRQPAGAGAVRVYTYYVHTRSLVYAVLVVAAWVFLSYQVPGRLPA